MKKILLCLFVFALSACTLNVKNTPKDVVKEFLDKYKNQDNEVINDLIIASWSARYLPAHLPDTRQLSRATPARSSA